MTEILQYILDKFKKTGSESLPIGLPLYRLGSFLELFNELKLLKGAEIGTRTGWFATIFHRHVPGLKLYCVDPWKVYADYVEYNQPEQQEKIEAQYRKAVRRLKPYPCEIIREFSPQAAAHFADDSLDFVHIDGNHSFEFVIADIAAWSKKVRPGGLITGHDYWSSVDRAKTFREEGMKEKDIIKVCQVKEAVLGWTKANQIRPWFITTRDIGPSWLWVKDTNGNTCS